MKKRHSMLFALAISVTVASCALIIFGSKSFAADSTPPDPATQLQSVFDKVQTSLNLTDEQTALWDQAETAMLAQMKEEFSRISATREQIRSSLSEASPDLHALAASLEQDMDAHVASAKQNHELWLAVYDSLDADQQATLRKAFISELTKMERMRRLGPPPGVEPSQKSATARSSM